MRVARDHVPLGRSGEGVASGRQLAERCDVESDHIQRARVELDGPFDTQVWLTSNFAALRFIEVRSNDDVDDTGFVLQQKEHEAFGGARPLATDHQASGFYVRTVTRGADLLGG